MEEDSVPSLFGIGFGSLGREHDPEVREDQREPDKRQIQHVRDVLLLHHVRVAEHGVPAAEDSGVEEGHRLRGHEHEEVGQDGECAKHPYEADEGVRAPRCADLCVAQGVADCNIALDSHAGQVQGCIEGGEDGDH